ncbi:DUF6545 domain-containing protein [Streptomyces bottropensis]|uniref:DUF6545 domain-containing protein n=1 Tax=Streptomyces bottropensis TaxID=42235 RepID=UPI003799AB3A
MSDSVFYFSGGLLILACALKLPALIRARGRDWLLSSICALLFLGGWVILLTAESAIIALRRVTGVTNLAAPLIYILLTAFSGASIVLVLHWRGKPDAAHTRRLSRITIVAYATICVLIAVLFAFGETPVERRRDFDIYYATTPYIREMIILYVLAHAVASLATSRLCWRWSHDMRGALRAGLRILATAYLMHFGIYDPAVAGAVVARWAGYDLGFLIEVARAVTAPSAILAAIGFIVPVAGHRSEDAIRYWRLAPLARAVQPVQGAANPLPLRLSRWKPALRLRLTQRQAYIADRLVTCRPLFDSLVQERARATALAQGATETGAAAIADAAMIITAIDDHIMANQAALYKPKPLVLGNGAAYTSDLAQISRALGAPIVKSSRRRTGAGAGSE